MSTKRITFGLGTVQLGVPYGNRQAEGLMPEAEATSILRAAAAANITFYDTAMAYGESEARIGRAKLSQLAPNAEISTKVPVVAPEIWQSQAAFTNYLTSAITTSRERLGLKQLGLLQFHQCELPFLSSPAVQATLSHLLSQNLCRRIGISVYEPEQALAALKIPVVTALQIPVNLVDRRFVAPQLLDAYNKHKTFLIARSVFLQGILVDNAALPPVKRAADLSSLKTQLLAAAAARHPEPHRHPERSEGPLVQPLQLLALRYIFGNLATTLDVGLIGIDSTASLHENLEMLNAAREPLATAELNRFATATQFATERKLLSPASWNL